MPTNKTQLTKHANTPPWSSLLCALLVTRDLHNCVLYIKLYKSFVTSILLQGCETWTMLADSEKRTQAFETKCLKKFPLISYLEHRTNDWVRSKITLVGQQEPILATVKRRRLAWFGHVNTPRQPLQYYPSGHLGELVTSWSAEEMLDE